MNKAKFKLSKYHRLLKISTKICRKVFLFALIIGHWNDSVDMCFYKASCPVTSTVALKSLIQRYKSGLNSNYLAKFFLCKKHC